MTKPVVLIAEELTPATVAALGPDFEVRRTDGADRAQLLAALSDAEAVLVRSATKVDAEALTAAPRLKVVARAGVGLDNVDVRAATQQGVMVVNAPTSNLASAAELAVALMLAAARSVRLALAGELVPDAVNVHGGVIAEEVRPGIALTEKLGRVFTALAGEVAQQLDVEVRGEITRYDVKVLELAALKGAFADVVEEQVSYVNAPLLAAERGLAVRLLTDPESPDHRNLVTLRGTLVDGAQLSVSGTLVGMAQRERLVEVDGYEVDIEPSEHLAFLRYQDRPGMVGIVGGVLGRARVNIGSMQVARDAKGGHALVVLTVDAASVRAVDLTEYLSRSASAGDAPAAPGARGPRSARCAP